MSLESPISKARGLGSAKEGASHWWKQRLTALALVILSIWFVFSIITLTGANYSTAHKWLANPFNTGLSLLLIIFVFFHLNLGIQVIIEDYIHNEWLKLSSLILSDLFSITIGLSCILAVFLVAFGGK